MVLLTIVPYLNLINILNLFFIIQYNIYLFIIINSIQDEIKKAGIKTCFLSYEYYV